MIKTILGFLAIPLALLLTLVQYLAYYVQKGMRWMSNKCTRFYNKVGSPWYIRRTKSGIVYKGPVILILWSILMENIEHLRDEKNDT